MKPTIGTMINAIRRSTEKESLWELSELLIEYYINKSYAYTENKLTVECYVESMRWDLIPWIAKNYNYRLAESTEYELEAEFSFPIALLRGKIFSYHDRKQYLFDWINKTGTCELVNLLIVLYPSCEDIKEVKRELGLFKPIEDLRQDLVNLENLFGE